MRPSGRHKNKPLVVKYEGKPYIRSTNFANVFEKRHKHILDIIRRYEKEREGEPKNIVFRPTSYQDRWNRSQPEFLISEEGFKLLTQNYSEEDQQKRIRQYQIQFNQHRKSDKPSKFSSLIKPMDNWNWPYIAYPTEGNGNGHGYIVGEVYINCFWYYVKPGNIVVDPMAGSGMAKRIYDDRAFWMGEHLYDFELHLFDLTPQQSFIKQNDLVQRFPLDHADYIFMDIPYFGMVQNQYSNNPDDLANQIEWEDYLDKLHKIAKNCASAQIQNNLCTIVSPNYRVISTRNRYIVPEYITKIWEDSKYQLYDKAYTTRRIQIAQNPGMARLNNSAKEKRVMLTDISEVLTFRRE